jgi:hypothetical protein
MAWLGSSGDMPCFGGYAFVKLVCLCRALVRYLGDLPFIVMLYTFILIG